MRLFTTIILCALATGCAVTTQNENKQGPSLSIAERLPVARWTEIPYVKRGDDFIVTLSAEHFSGISHVIFSIDGGEPVVVTEKTPHPETGYPEYLLPVGEQEDGYHEVTATVVANSGDTLTLEGDSRRFGNLDVRNNGLNSFVFETGEYETLTVGPTGDYLTIDEALADGVEGMRLELEAGTHVLDLSRTHRGTAGDMLDPIVIDGNGQATITSPSGGAGMVRDLSVVFRGIEFRQPLRTSSGNRMLKSTANSNEMVGFRDCVITPDSDDPYSWRQIEWIQLVGLNWHGGIFSIGNSYEKVSCGISRVTLSKGDSFEYRIWDAFNKNPGAVLDLFDNKSTGNGAIDGPGCGNSSLHGDILQFWNPASLEEYGPLRNRLFADITSMNMDYQVAHFEGDWRADENGVKPAVVYSDWYFTRWTVDSAVSSSSFNFASSGAPVHYRNMTLEDLTFSRASIDVGISDWTSFEGMKARRCITWKWRRSGVCPLSIFDEIDGWHTETPSGCDTGLTVGPVDWADRDPDGPVEETCDGNSWSVALPDLSNTVFTTNDCYTSEDLTRVLAAYGSSDPEADLNGDGIVDAEDLTIVLANQC